MRITESQLRRIIREEILLEKTLWDELQGNRNLLPKRPRSDVNYDDEEDVDDEGNVIDKEWVYDPAARDVNSYRRTVKRLWNKFADMSFFQDPKRVQPIHFLGFFSGKRGLADYFTVSGSKRIPGIHIPNRNELSCYGFIPPRSLEDLTDGGKPFFTFKSYRVTFASMEDAGTERLSKASDDTKRFYSNSGLPKRPSTELSISSIPVDDDDGELYDLDEVVIANWIIDTYHGPESDRTIAEELGLRFEPID